MKATESRIEELKHVAEICGVKLVVRTVSAAGYRAGTHNVTQTNAPVEHHVFVVVFPDDRCDDICNTPEEAEDVMYRYSRHLPTR